MQAETPWTGCLRASHYDTTQLLAYIPGNAVRYEKERLPRVRTVYQKGNSAASAKDKEEYLYKPRFKMLWRKQACSPTPSVHALNSSADIQKRPESPGMRIDFQRWITQ